MLIAVGVPSRSAFACEDCCARCGTGEAEMKVCRLVCTEKKLTVNCWSCETEDICLPGPSRRTCPHCDVACDQECCHGSRGDWRKYFMWSEWTPCGAPMCPPNTRRSSGASTRRAPNNRMVVPQVESPRRTQRTRRSHRGSRAVNHGDESTGTADREWGAMVRRPASSCEASVTLCVPW